jgi:hypothetical protein
MKPILVTNAGIYGTDNRPLGLLISSKGKLHDLNTAAGAGRGNKWHYETLRALRPEIRVLNHFWTLGKTDSLVLRRHGVSQA